MLILGDVWTETRWVMVKLIDLILFYDVGVSTAEADPGEFNVTADLNTNLFEIALLANDLPTD